MNCVVDLLSLICGHVKWASGKPPDRQQFKASRKEREHEYGRFTNCDGPSTPPWVAKAAHVKALRIAIRDEVKMVDPNVSLGDPLRFPKHLKTHECILFSGDVGVYVLWHLQIDIEYFQLFRRFLRMLESMCKKEWTTADLNRSALNAPKLLTE